MLELLQLEARELLSANYLSIAQNIMDSQEYHVDLINNLYSTVLIRGADQPGLNYWIHSDLSDEAILAGFQASHEFSHVRDDDSLWISDVYKTTLGRQPEPTGLIYWRAQLQVMDRSQVAYAIATSLESERRYIQIDYKNLLHRSGAFSELDYWNAQIVLLGQTREAITVQIASAKESISENNLTKTSWIDNLCQFLVSRKPTFTEQRQALAAIPSRNLLITDLTEDPVDGGNTHSETTIATLHNIVIVAYNDSGSYIPPVIGEGGTFPRDRHYTGYSISQDSGKSFSDMGTLPYTTEGDFGDPSLSASPTKIYLSTLSYAESVADDPGIQIYQSTGDTFQYLSTIHLSQGYGYIMDKDWLAYGGTQNNQDTLYATFTLFPEVLSTNHVQPPADILPYGIYLVKSVDSGNTWSPPQALTTSVNAQGSWITVAADGSILVFWSDQPLAAPPVPQGTIRMRRSIAGTDFDSEVIVAPTQSLGVNGDLGLEFRTNTFPQAVAGKNGHIYVTYNDKTATDQIYLVTSNDFGMTWGTPIVISDNNLDNVMPSISISPDGKNLGIFWYTHDANKVMDEVGTIIHTEEMDRTPIFRITDESFPSIVGVDITVGPVYMGDYNGSMGTMNGFDVSWADNRLNEPDVRFEMISAV